MNIYIKSPHKQSQIYRYKERGIKNSYHIQYTVCSQRLQVSFIGGVIQRMSCMAYFVKRV